MISCFVEAEERQSVPILQYLPDQFTRSLSQAQESQEHKNGADAAVVALALDSPVRRAFDRPELTVEPSVDSLP